MNFPQHQDYPPPDFVAFLAQRGGLSQEAAEHRLENWFGEYHQTANGRAKRGTQAAPLSY